MKPFDQRIARTNTGLIGYDMQDDCIIVRKNMQSVVLSAGCFGLTIVSKDFGICFVLRKSSESAFCSLQTSDIKCIHGKSQLVLFLLSAFCMCCDRVFLDVYRGHVVLGPCTVSVKLF